MSDSQLEIALPPPSAEDIIADRLAVAVAEFNEEVDPVRRVELIEEIRRLRGFVGGTRRAP